MKILSRRTHKFGQQRWLNLLDLSAKRFGSALIDYTEVILIIRWATLEQWKANAGADLQTIEDKFIQALRESYSIVDSAKYQVRKFPHL